MREITYDIIVPRTINAKHKSVKERVQGKPIARVFPPVLCILSLRKESICLVQSGMSVC